MEGTTPQLKPALDGAGIFLVLFTVCVFFLPIFTLFPPVSPSRSDAIRATHIKVGLSRSKSNLRRAQREPSSASQSGSPTKVESLWIYPVKSCKGIEVARSKVLPTGLEFDRLFTFAQLRSPFPVGLDSTREEKGQHRWEFITQRQFPLLATLQVDLYVPDASTATGQASDRQTESFLVVRFPWREEGLRGALEWIAAKIRRGLSAQPEKEVLLPVSFPSDGEIKQLGYTYEQVTIWRDTLQALNVAAELPRELRLYLGVSNKLGLFRIDPDRLREVHRCAPGKAEAGYQPVTGFQDAYPLHLINQASVRDLDSKIAKDENMGFLDVRRFRANIIVDGPEAYDEDTWKSIRLRAAPSGKSPDSTYHVSCRTVRCKLPNVNPDSGFRHPVEPDKSLRKLRDVDAGAPLKGCLGMQMTPLFDDAESPEDMLGWLEVGMAVEVLGRGSHHYIPQ